VAVFGGVILHNFSTYGFAIRAAVLNQSGGSDPISSKLFNVQFTAAVKPGDKLETSIWEIGKGSNGIVKVGSETKALATGKSRLKAVKNNLL
jgi:peroxisomal enoyl-CoA hydratase 2